MVQQIGVMMWVWPALFPLPSFCFLLLPPPLPLWQQSKKFALISLWSPAGRLCRPFPFRLHSYKTEVIYFNIKIFIMWIQRIPHVLDFILFSYELNMRHMKAFVSLAENYFFRLNWSGLYCLHCLWDHSLDIRSCGELILLLFFRSFKINLEEEVVRVLLLSFMMSNLLV